MAILEVSNLKKIYITRFGGNQVQALSDVNFTVEPGEPTAEIIDALADAGLIRDKFSFRCQIIFYDKIQKGVQGRLRQWRVRFGFCFARSFVCRILACL